MPRHVKFMLSTETNQPGLVQHASVELAESVDFVALASSAVLEPSRATQNPPGTKRQRQPQERINSMSKLAKQTISTFYVMYLIFLKNSITYWCFLSQIIGLRSNKACLIRFSQAQTRCEEENKVPELIRLV